MEKTRPRDLLNSWANAGYFQVLCGTFTHLALTMACWVDVIIKIFGKERRKIHLEKGRLWKEITLFKYLKD